MGTVLLATDGSEYARRAADHAALSVGEVLAIARERGVSATGDTRHGEPHEVISAVAGELPAELIVVGEHGDHDRHFAGVGRRVADSAPCEVIVVTAGEPPGVE